MASIKKDDNKQKWEETEFPLVCETCLGDNPYIRMTKEPHGKPCATCETPFTVFAWQAGTKGRLKRVEICKSCAQAKNVCQVCIYDLQYGLPVKVRDRILAEGGSLSSSGSGAGGGSGGGGAGNALGMAVPQSDANRSWFNAQQERCLMVDDANNNNTSSGTMIDPRTTAKLQSMARMEPRYERNLPKLCSFFAKGECNRGSSCPFRHELPKDRNDPLAKQNTKDRFYGTNDPVANAILGKRKERMEERKKKAATADAVKDGNNGGGGGPEGDERAVSTVYIRFDERNTSTINIQITEMEIRDAFYSYGEISSVRMHSNKGAFVEYTNGDAASLAIASQNRKEIKGRLILVNWARQPKRGNTERLRGDATVSSSGNQHGPIRPLAPPGSSSSKSGGLALPVGFTPSPQVAAAAASRIANSTGLAATGIGSTGATKTSLSASSSSSTSSSLGVPRPGGGSGGGGGLGVPRPGSGGVGVPRPGGGGLGVPRPGGGVIRRPGQGLGRNAAPKPYYPSADPGRLGSRSVTGTGD